MDLTYRAGWFEWAERFARFSPRWFLRFLGASWGTLFAWTQPRKAAVVKENLALLGLARPPNPARVYAEFGGVLADYFYAGARSVRAALALVDEYHGVEHLAAARAAGRGALMLTPHLGFFELGGAVMHERGFPMVALTKPEPSPELTAWRAAYRLRWGVETVEVGAAGHLQFVEVAKHLQAGKFVAALFDRPHPSQSFCARLPGGLLPCSSGILLLAILAKCPVIPVTIVAKPNRRYRLDALAPIVIERRGSSAETLNYYTQVLVDAVLPAISAHPEQWFQFAPLKAEQDVPAGI
jgi:KDO2-lipid IV(A) lauroyltransferase